MKRRQILKLSALSIPAAAGGYYYLYSNRPKHDVDAVLHYARTLKGVDAIGRQYAESKQSPIMVNELGETLFSRLSAIIVSQPLTLDQLPEKIQQLIQQDYSSSRICKIDDWYLSQTECELAALSYLQEGTAKTDGPQWGYEFADEGDVVEIKKWGPQSTFEQKGFNIQSDGHYGIWVQIDNPPQALEVYIGDIKASVTVLDTVVTLAIYEPYASKLIEKPAVHPIYFYNKTTNLKQKIGDFNVKETPEYTLLSDGSRSTVFCKVSRWGPQESIAGEVFNAQPTGRSAFWFRIACAPQGMLIKFGDTMLKATVREDMVTTSLDHRLLTTKPGLIPISFIDPTSGEELEIGQMKVMEKQP